MLLTAELLLHFQRCSRRAFLDVYGDFSQRDAPADYLLKLTQDGLVHRQTVLAKHVWQEPQYPREDWAAGAAATLALMRQGVEQIHRGVLLTEGTSGFQFLSRPDLLIRQPGTSAIGDWLYAPTSIKLGKRPKLEYQIAAAFDVQVLATVQGAWAETAWLILRERGAYAVDLWKVMPQMQMVLEDCIATLRSPVTPEVFIARSRCNLCPWLTSCYTAAQAQRHMSLLPGVTDRRYSSLQDLNVVTIEALAATAPQDLESLPGFGEEVSQKLVRQAQSTLQNQAIVIPNHCLPALPTTAIELYFDIEAEPELDLVYLHGVLVIDRQAQTEAFYPLLAENPQDEPLVWHQFLDLLDRYPDAPVFHFCPYEAQTVTRLAKLYRTPLRRVEPMLDRFVDLHDYVTRSVTLPVESYALKSIARHLGFDWRDAGANGAQSICWYTQWLHTGDRDSLEAVVRYNEDDCRAMYHLKNWLVDFLPKTRAAGVKVAVNN